MQSGWYNIEHLPEKTGRIELTSERTDREEEIKELKVENTYLNQAYKKLQRWVLTRLEVCGLRAECDDAATITDGYILSLRLTRPTTKNSQSNLTSRFILYIVADVSVKGQLRWRRVKPHSKRWQGSLAPSKIGRA